AHHTAVEQRQTGHHEQDEAGRDQHPSRVAGVELLGIVGAGGGGVGGEDGGGCRQETEHGGQRKQVRFHSSSRGECGEGGGLVNTRLQSACQTGKLHDQGIKSLK